VVGPLVTSTVKAAVLLSTGQSGSLSAGVVSLAEGASKAMVPTKYKLAALFLVATGLLAVGANALARREPPQKPETPSSGESVATNGPGTETIVLTGQVVGPDGKPVAGARLYWPRIPKERPVKEEEIEIPERGVTSSDGSFRLELPASDVRFDWNSPALVALADGYGLGWTELPEKDPPTGLSIRLVKDQPIRGRLLSTEGKPISGVKVGVGPVFAMPEDNLEYFLTAWKRDWQSAIGRIGKPLYYPLTRPLAVPMTDKDGRFQIQGIGAERVAVVSFQAPGVAQESIYVVCRAGLDPARYNQAVRDRTLPKPRSASGTPLLHGPAFDHVASSSRVIEGTIRTPDGKPAEGIPVFVNVGYNNTVTAVSDAAGHYRLQGLPKQDEYLLHAEPRGKDPWLRWSTRLHDAEGLQLIKQDIELVRGIIVTGRILDRVTGKGVRGGLRYAPLPDNKYFGTKPGYDSYRSERLTTMSDADGRFRLAAIPGSGVLLVQAEGADARIDGVPVNPYRQAMVDSADRQRLAVSAKGGNRYFATAGNSYEFLDIMNACKVIDLAEGTDSYTCEVYLERGRTQTLSIQDPEGKPLDGAVVAGVTATWPIAVSLKGSSCTVYALESETPRELFVLHSDRKLAGSLKVRGDEDEPPAVKLRPTGSVTGRFLDLDARPITGARVDLNFPDSTVQELYRQMNQRQEPVLTDKDGRFRIDGVISDVKFGLAAFQGNTLLVGEPRVGQRQVESGKTLDLDDVRTRPQPE
jgi:hypothetical protein